MTARQIISRRLGRDLGPLATMPRDMRRAHYIRCCKMNPATVLKAWPLS